MCRSKLLISLLVFVLPTFHIASAEPTSGPQTCWIDKGGCKHLAGKRLWVSIPAGNPNVVEVTFTQHDLTTANTLKLKSGASFLVEKLTETKYLGEDYYVRLDDGRRGWVSTTTTFLLDFDPVARSKQAAEECARRGQPKIGMTPAELIETCWRKPRRIVMKTTAAGKEENYIYGIGHVVKFTDGKVSEIVEAR